MFFEFILLSKWAILGTMILSCGLSIIGAILISQNKSNNVEVLSHAVFPGIIFGILISSTFNLAYDSSYGRLIVLISSMLSSCIFLVMDSFILDKNKKDIFDTFFLSVFFGMGLLIINYLNHRSYIYAKIAERYLYGNLFLVSKVDTLYFLYVSCIFLLTIFLYRRKIKFFACDACYYNLITAKKNDVNIIIFIFSCIYISISMESLGMIIVSGQTIVPALCAKMFASSFNTLMTLSSIFSALITVFGISCALAIRIISDVQEVSSASIIMMSSIVLLIFSVLSGPKSPISVYQFYKKKLFEFRILQEDILKSLLYQKRSLDVYEVSAFVGSGYYKTLLALVILNRKKFVKLLNDNKYELSRNGSDMAYDILKKHNMLEKYLENSINIDHRNVHDIAENIEHVIDDEYINNIKN